MASGGGANGRSMREVSGMIMFYYLLFSDSSMGYRNVSISLYVNFTSKGKNELEICNGMI